MRIFGKVLQTLRLSRRQSNFKPRRCCSFLCYHNFARRSTLNNNRIIKNVTMRSVASKSDSSGKGTAICKAHIANILPVALIESKSPTTTTKIMLIPLNLFDGDEEGNKHTMKTLSVIREHARQIEAFTENLMDTNEPAHYNAPLSTTNTRTLLDKYSGHDDVTLWSHEEEASNSHALQSTPESFKGSSVSLYENLERAVAEQEMNRIEAHDCYDVAAWNSSKRDLVVIVPENLEEKLQQMAISSMQLAFEMDMSNIRDAILRSAAIKNINLFKPPTPKSLQDPTLTMKANLDLEKSDANSTIPLDFNALIQGTVEIDPSKYTPTNLGEIKVPEFNDCVTAIAANICSTALQKGFPADISRMAYSTNTPATKKASSERNPHIVCVREGSKGCISPGNAVYQKFIPKGGAAAYSKDAVRSDKEGSTCISSEISLLSSSEIIGYNSRGLMSCKAYALALIEATKRRAERTKTKTEPCDDSKRVKKEAIKKKDKCGDPKNNPCTKPLIDECGNEIKKNCPNKKKDKKKDTCIKDDPCKKADSNDAGALQLSSSKTPCGGKKNKNKSNEEEKNTGCGKPKKKGNRCNTESDACKKPKECPKPKNKKCDLGDPCNPCPKPKEKPSKPKKTCSSGTPVLYSVKCPLPNQQVENPEKDSKFNASKNLCDVKKSNSVLDVKKADSKGEQKRSKSSDSSHKSGSSDSKKKCRPFNSVKEGGKSKCGPPKKSASESKCGAPKKSASDSKCGKPNKSSSDSKCGAPKKDASDSKCGKPKKSPSDSKCGAPKKDASDSKCGKPQKSSSDSKCGAPKKDASDSKCGKPKKSPSDSKCGAPKKDASDSKCGKPKKSSSDSKCGAPKKDASDSKCGKPKKSPSDSKCGAPKKAASKSNKDECKTYEGFCKSQTGKSKCGPLKKSSSESKCGAPKKSASDSKCGKPNKSSSDSKCGAPKKDASDSKCGKPKKSPSDSKCGAPKKDASDSKCGKPQKSSSDSKCGAPKKDASDSKCGKPKKSPSDSKCGAPKKDASDSKCGKPKKSSSDSKCGAPKKDASDSKCGKPKKSSSDSKCGAPKKSASDSKCGKPKKSSSDSKCGAPKKDASDSKCGKPKKSPSDSKCGAPKKDASDSKCGKPKKSSSDSKCGAPKKDASDSKCGKPKKSPSDSKCGAPKKDASDSKCGKPKESSSDSKCGAPKKDASKSNKDECKSQKPSCSKDKKPSEGKAGNQCKSIKNLCDLKKSKSSCSSDKKSSDESEKKCKPVKSLCDVKTSSKSGSDSKSKKSCNSGTDSKSKESSEGDCKSKKNTAPNCKGKSGTGSGSGCKKYSTVTNPKPIIEILPIKRFFSSISIYTIPHGLISWRQFSSKKGSKGKKDGQGSTMCMKHKTKKMSKRVDVLARKKPKDCYAEEGDMCQEPLCKDPKKSNCADRDKKENENPSSLSLKTYLHIAGPLSSLKKRYYGSDTCKETKVQCYEKTTTDDECEYEYEDENESDECDVENENDSNLINETRNEVIRIMEPCTVERCLEAIPNFSEYDVLVRTAAVALSGSDLHYYETGGKSYPGMTLGHDATGVVEEVGCSITKIRPGDRVVVESGLACGICDYCKRGCYNICNHLVFNGFLRKYQVHPADLCHKIPDDVNLIEATLTQTLALGCQACFKAQVLPTTNVLVIGSGPTAISTALCARAIGIGNICIASTMKDPLEMIEKTFKFNCMHYEQDMQYRLILECLYSVLHAWPDAVINCAISEKTMNLAVMALKPCGICVLAECDAECACFNAMDVLMKNLKLLPSFRSINMFPTALSLIEGGKAPIGRLVEKVFEWQEVEQAFRKALCESNIGNKKVIVRCAEEEEETYRKEDCKT